MGIEVLAIILIAGTFAGSINNMFEIVRNIKSIFPTFKRKTQVERRLEQIGPVIALIQSKITKRLLMLGIVVTLLCAVCFVADGAFDFRAIGGDEIADIAVTSVVAVFAGSLYRHGVSRRVFRLSEKEISLLEEYDSLFDQYIEESIEKIEEKAT